MEIRIFSTGKMFGKDKNMPEYKYKCSWPKDNLYVDGYVHQVTNFRYHAHADDFELNILLQGKQHFYSGTDLIDLKEDDVILVNPNTGHASYCDPEGTIAFVLHFSSLALKQFVKKGQTLKIGGCLSDDQTRNELRYRAIRKCAASIIYYLNQGDPFSQYMAKANAELMVGTLCTMFDTEASELAGESDEETQRVIRSILEYMEAHYGEKITLEDIGEMTGYNRTYVSTLFHQSVGIRFYDYLMRLRLQNAIRELVTTDHPLTEIAMNNGFADLKTFNARFREILKILPSEYRGMIEKKTVSPEYYEVQSIPCTDPMVARKLKEYMEK